MTTTLEPMSPEKRHERIMEALFGRYPSGRATHERSQSSLSPPSVSVPNAEYVSEIENTIEYQLCDCVVTLALVLCEDDIPQEVRDMIARKINDATLVRLLNASDLAESRSPQPANTQCRYICTGEV